jgi:hypothetical protein
MMEIGLTAYLLANSGVQAALVDRIYPIVLPEAPAYPAATYLTLSQVPDYTSDGNSNYCNYRVQIESFGNTYADAKNVYAAIFAALDSFSGTWPDGTIIGNIRLITSSDFYDSDSRIYRTRTDYIITTQS